MEQQFYECHKHGVPIGGHCDQCEIRVFIPPLVMQAEIDKLKEIVREYRSGWRHDQCDAKDTRCATCRKADEALHD